MQEFEKLCRLCSVSKEEAVQERLQRAATLRRRFSVSSVGIHTQVRESSGDSIDVERLKAVAEGTLSNEIEGTTLEDLCRFFLLFDENGDGVVDLEEFRAMILASHDACNLFMGSEVPDKLSERQIEALLTYDWPQQYAGPGDVDDYHGLGGLLEQMKKDIRLASGKVDGEDKAQKEEEMESNEQRMLHIDKGDRSDPLLVQLDSLAAELEKMERGGLLEEATFNPDWRTECGEGEELYVRRPENMESFFKRMGIKMLTKAQRREKLKRLADELLQNRIIAVPPQVWVEDDIDYHHPDRVPEQEEILVNRLGFIFLAYRVDFW